MIRVTRLNGERFALNPDLIERVEGHPDTVAFLVDGTKYVVKESVDEVLARDPRVPRLDPRHQPTRWTAASTSPPTHPVPPAPRTAAPRWSPSRAERSADPWIRPL